MQADPKMIQYIHLRGKHGCPFLQSLSLIMMLYELYLYVTAGTNIPDCSHQNDAILCSCALLKAKKRSADQMQANPENATLKRLGNGRHTRILQLFFWITNFCSNMNT